MYQLKATASFDSAHFLAGYPGKCANLHGHHWVIEATIAAETLQPDGPQHSMLVDFHDLKSTVRELADYYDHALIYEEHTLQNTTTEAMLSEGFRLIAVPFRPTAECLAKHFYEKLQTLGLPIQTVAVYETPDNCALYTESPSV